MYQKVKPYRSEKYKKFIRSKPCFRCGITSYHISVVPAHQNFGYGGMGTKAPDIWTIPLCTNCHSDEHRVGHDTFWGNKNLKSECMKLIDEYFGSKIKDRCKTCVVK